MRRYNNNWKNDGRDSTSNYNPPPDYVASPVMVRPKDVMCGFGKHRFYIGKELKGNNSPLLLPCGHATCNSCEAGKADVPCPQCPHVSGVTRVEKRERLPYNMYVIGLAHAMASIPMHALQEPDFTFHVPKNALVRQHFERGPCKDCGMIAYCECRGCNALLCRRCYKKIHNKVLKDHYDQTVILDKNAYELPVTIYCPNHEDNFAEYYCEDCDFEGCSHCMFKSHKEHNTCHIDEINGSALRELDAVLVKIDEAWQRTRQTKKEITEKMVPLDAGKIMQETEQKLTKQFIHMHGVLQNLEIEMKERIRRQRDELKKNVDDFREKLDQQEEFLASVYAVASTSRSEDVKYNIKKLTEKLVDVAEVPCHLLSNENRDDQIRWEMDPNWAEKLKDLMQLYVPENPKFSLLKTNELPDEYTPEPIESNETLNNYLGNIMDASLRAASSYQRDSPSPSVSSPANQSFDESITSNSVAAVAAAIPQHSSSMPSREKSERVTVLHINDPTDFYVRKNSEKTTYDEMQLLIEQCLESGIQPPSSIKHNGLYIVQNSKDQQWYRGRVTRKYESEDGQDICDVFFIDLGSCDYNVNIDRLRKIQTGLNMAPGVAMNCCLDEIVPMEGNEWQESVIEKFESIVGGQELVMTILRPDSIKPTVDLKLSHGDSEFSLREVLLYAQQGKINSYQKMKRINPQSVHQFYYKDLSLEDKYVKVKVLNVVSPTCIYVEKFKDKAYMEKMTDFQYEYGKALKKENLSIKNPELGDTVAFAEEVMFYRGYITNIMHEKSKLEIFLVDTGETKTAKYSRVTRLPSRFCTWTAQAIKISLANIKPVEGETYSSKAIAYLQKNLTDQLVQILPIEKSGNTYSVVMVTSNETNVNANLVSKNYAVSTGPHSKHTTLNNDIRAPAKTKKIKKNSKSKTKQQAPVENLSFRDEQIKADSERRKLPNRRAEETNPYRVRVHLKKVISPDEIYVSEASNAVLFEVTNQQMQKFYSENEAQVEGELEHGICYCVYSPKDRQFCRANFVEMIENKPGKANMLLIDLMELIEVEVSKVQPLNRRFLEADKNMFRVKLAGVTPCGGSETWPSSSCRKLEEIIEDSGSDTKYYITLAGSTEEEEIIPVDLVVRRNVAVGPTEPNRRESISVKRRLIDDGHAFPIRGFDDDKEKELAVELKKKLKIESSVLDATFINAHESKNNLTPIEEEEAMAIDGEGETKTNNKNDAEVKKNDRKVEEAEEEDEEKESEMETAEDYGEEDEDSKRDSSGELTSLPPKMEDWIPAAHLTEDELIGKVTYVDEDCRFYFYPDTQEYRDTLEYIKDTLYKQYHDKTIKKYDTTWEVGDLCIAKYHFDNKWYRAKVTQVDSTVKAVSVQFVDYGNIEDCQIGALKKRIALTKIPIQATCAAIAGLKPASGEWCQADLDIIHSVIVDKRVKIKIVNKPPKPWKAKLWLIDGNKVYLPWYIKNKTQVKCIIEDTLSSDADSDESLSKESLKADSTIRAVANEPNFVIHVNEDDSDDSSEEESVDETSVAVVKDSDNDDDNSDTIIGTGDVESENTVKMDDSNEPKVSDDEDEQNSGSTNLSRLRSQASIDSSDTIQSPDISADLINGNNEEGDEEDYNGNQEELLSGNSIYLAKELDANFDVQSVMSEALNSEMNFPLVASTPLNTSFTEDDIDIDFGPKDINFYNYKVHEFQMSIGMDFSPIRMTGFIVDCSNKTLTDWIERNKLMHEEIQIAAEQQPLLALRKGAIGVAEYTDSQWYRAQIVQKTVSAIKVEFIDFGNRCIYDDGNQIRVAKKEWLEVPRLSFTFKLHNVRVAPGKQKEAHKAMTEILNGKDVWTAQIKEYERELGIELYSDKECKELAYSSMIKDGLLEVIESEVD